MPYQIAWVLLIIVQKRGKQSLRLHLTLMRMFDIAQLIVNIIQVSSFGG